MCNSTCETLGLVGRELDWDWDEQAALLLAWHANLHAAVGLDLWPVVAERGVHGDMDGRASLSRVVLVDQAGRVGYVKARGEPADDGNGGVDLAVGVERSLGKLDINSHL